MPLTRGIFHIYSLSTLLKAFCKTHEGQKNRRSELRTLLENDPNGDVVNAG